MINGLVRTGRVPDAEAEVHRRTEGAAASRAHSDEFGCRRVEGKCRNPIDKSAGTTAMIGRSFLTITRAALQGALSVLTIISAAGDAVAQVSAGCAAVMANTWNGQATLGSALGKRGDFNKGDYVKFSFSGGTNPNGSQGLDFGGMEFSDSLSPVAPKGQWSNLPGDNTGTSAGLASNWFFFGGPGTSWLSVAFQSNAPGQKPQPVTQTVSCSPATDSWAWIKNLNPLSGVTSGGTNVVIDGGGFTGATAVAFGKTPATSFTVNNDTSITAIAPPGSGTVDMTVTTPSGQSAVYAGDQFTYGTAPLAPTVTSISPKSGTNSGANPNVGTGVTIKGTNLGVPGDEVAVLFGGTPSIAMQLFQNQTQIIAIPPPGSSLVDVTVITKGGTSATSAADQFRYAINTHDFLGSGWSDILFRDTAGDVAVWEMGPGGQISQTAFFGTVPMTYTIMGQRDFNGDGIADLLWRDNAGNLAIWIVSGGGSAMGFGLGNVPTTWTVYGTGDVNGDGNADLLWRDSSGNTAIWFMSGTGVAATASLGNVPTNWTIVGDDNHGNIFWHDDQGNYAAWQMNGSQVGLSGGLGNVPLATWQIVGLGDFDGDGNTDILWRDTSGDTAIWFLNSSLGIASTASLGKIPNSWSVAQTGDYNGDGYSDILWTDTTGDLAIWFMNGPTVSSTGGFGSVGTSWSVQSANAE
jgi:hypothetical protein